MNGEIWIRIAALGVIAVGAPATAAEEACAPVSDIKFSSPPPFETQSLRFTSGNVELEGCLYRPNGHAKFPLIVAVSGSDDMPTAADVYSVIHAKAFAARGIGFFAYNKRGMGNSGGTFTNTDFEQRGADVASAVHFTRKLADVTEVGLWGSSQAGWVIPQALRHNDGVSFIILTSPSGVNPFEQVSYFIHGVATRLGLSETEASEAERIHRTVVKYYATGEGYRAAQKLVLKSAGATWFERFRTNKEWDLKIGSGGRVLTPAELQRAWKSSAGDFEYYRSNTTFMDFASAYRRIDRPVLIANGTNDSNLPVVKSKAAIRDALGKAHNGAAEFKDFEGAEHGIQDGPRVRAAYLDYIAEWAAQHFSGQ